MYQVRRLRERRAAEQGSKAAVLDMPVRGARDDVMHEAPLLLDRDDVMHEAPLLLRKSWEGARHGGGGGAAGQDSGGGAGVAAASPTMRRDTGSDVRGVRDAETPASRRVEHSRRVHPESDVRGAETHERARPVGKAAPGTGGNALEAALQPRARRRAEGGEVTREEERWLHEAVNAALVRCETPRSRAGAGAGEGGGGGDGWARQREMLALAEAFNCACFLAATSRDSLVLIRRDVGDWFLREGESAMVLREDTRKSLLDLGEAVGVGARAARRSERECAHIVQNLEGFVAREPEDVEGHFKLAAHLIGWYHCQLESAGASARGDGIRDGGVSAEQIRGSGVTAQDAGGVSVPAAAQAAELGDRGKQGPVGARGCTYACIHTFKHTYIQTYIHAYIQAGRRQRSLCLAGACSLSLPPEQTSLFLPVCLSRGALPVSVCPRCLSVCPWTNGLSPLSVCLSLETSILSPASRARIDSLS